MIVSSLVGWRCSIIVSWRFYCLWNYPFGGPRKAKKGIWFEFFCKNCFILWKLVHFYSECRARRAFGRVTVTVKILHVEQYGVLLEEWDLVRFRLQNSWKEGSRRDKFGTSYEIVGEQQRTRRKRWTSLKAFWSISYQSTLRHFHRCCIVM